MDKDWDIYNTKAKYFHTISLIDGWSTSESNKRLILEFLKRTEIEGIGIVQRMKYLDSFRTFLGIVNKGFQDLTEGDLDDFVLGMKGYAAKTRRTRWYCIRKFLLHIGKEGLLLKVKPRFKVERLKLPEELLTQEEIDMMISKAYNIRDKAFISVLYETGCRTGEMLSRRIKHVSFDEYGGVIIVNGKTGSRRVRIVRSVPLLANWIDNHPMRDNPEAFLWVSMNDYRNPVQYIAMSAMVKKLAKRVGVRKRVHLHLFRHTRSTHLASRLTEAQMKEYLGWTQRSEMASVYVHLSGRDVDNAILELNGISPDSQEKGPMNRLRSCSKCGNKSDPTAKFCSKCGTLLEQAVPENSEFQEFLYQLYQRWKFNRFKC